MKEYKDDIKTIIKVLAYCYIFLAVGTIKNPIFWWVCLIYWTGDELYSVFKKIQYKKGKENYLLFPTENDDNHRTTQIVLGLIMSAAMIGMAIWTNDFDWSLIILMTIASLTVINGIINVPRGCLNIENNVLKLTGLKQDIDIRQIETISIKNTSIELTNIYKETTVCRYFAIDEQYAHKIEQYLLAKRTDEMKFNVENKVV